MPHIDFATVDDVDDFSPVPPDQYPVEPKSVEETSTQAGDAMWRVRLLIVGGPYKGRYIFDNLVFSAAAMKRVKLFCRALGLDVSGEVDLTPDLIIGRACQATVELEDYEDAEGNVRPRNVVPFAGYEEADTADLDEAETEDDGEDNVPWRVA